MLLVAAGTAGAGASVVNDVAATAANDFFTGATLLLLLLRVTVAELDEDAAAAVAVAVVLAGEGGAGGRA